MFAVPSSTVNSMLDYLSKKLGLVFRKEMTKYFNNKYIDDLVFYKLNNIDQRI